MTQNQLKWLDLEEAKRANLAKEGLTTRQLVETERTQQLHDEGFIPSVARADQAAGVVKKISEMVRNWMSLLG